jgi:CD63 antigen
LKATGDLTKALDTINDTEYFAVSVIVLGAFIFLVSFCGCCGAIRESECFLNLYALALIFIAIVQVVIALYSCFYNEEIQKRVEDCWDKLWAGKSVEINSRAIAEIQNYVECCGDTGIQSWAPEKPGDKCEMRFYSKGCRESIKAYVQDSSAVISYISLAMAIVEVNYRKLY